MATQTLTCDLIEQSARPTLGVHAHVAIQALPGLIGSALGQVAAHLARHGERPAGPAFVAYHNQDMSDLDVEIGFPVAHAIAGQGDVEAGVLPGGRQATCLYTGPYTGIGQAYTALSEWMSLHDCRPAGPAYEFYLNDPQQTRPEALQTRVMFPLADVASVEP